MGEGGPLFSVVIPAFNRANVLARAVASVFAQSCKDFEIVVIDDGSSDDVEGALARYRGGSLTLIRQPNGGGGKARNTGIDAAKGRFIAFLDSDDVFLPGHLAAMRTVVEGFDDVVGYAQVIVDRDNGKTFLKPPRAILQGESMAEYLCCARGFVQTSALVVPTLLARKVRYRDGMRFGQDTDFAIRLSLEKCRFVMTRAPGAIWSDVHDPKRVSSLRKGVSNIPWIEEMRPYISERAYHGYRGWHIAKGMAKTSKLGALRLYASAIAHRSYKLPLALIVLCQIFMPDEGYRRIANGILALKTMRPRTTQREAVS